MDVGARHPIGNPSQRLAAVLALAATGLIAGCADRSRPLSLDPLGELPVPAALAFANTPGPAAAQQTLPPVHVVVLDSAGFVDSSASLTVSVLLQTYSGSASLGGTTTAHVSHGSVDFTDLTISAPGSYVLVAFTPGLGAGRSAPFAITAAANVR